MKLSELEIGETYWYCRRRDWDFYTHRGWDQYPVRIESLDRYRYSPPVYTSPRNWTPDQSAALDPKGKFIRAIVPADPNAPMASDHKDRVVYVEPRMIRAKLAEHRDLVKRNREEMEAEQVEQAARRQAATDLRDRLQERAETLGLTGARVGLGSWDDATPVLTVVGEDAITELLDRLERAGQALP